MNGALASTDGAHPTSTSYYGRPVVKPHVWTPYIPAYFWIGGLTGAAAVQSAVERVRGNGDLATVQQRAALAGALVAPALLIADLGVPLRFYNMLRVFKPTSPMSVGSWVLLSFGGATATANAAQLIGLAPLAHAGEAAAALLGPVLLTYTAVLVADTATPVWHAARRELPFVFAASAIGAAGAVGTIFGPAGRSESARRFMIAGGFGAALTTEWMERRIGSFLSEPYQHGTAGTLKRIATFTSLCGAMLGLVTGNRGGRIAAAALVAAGGICERYAVLAAGKASALDPKYTVEPQRARLDARGGAPATA